MAKITFMGAGSTVFARNVLGDCMCSPALCDSEIALYDIDSQRLEDSQVILSAINQNVNQGRAKIKTYLGEKNRKEALRGADFVVNAIQVGGYDPCTVTDFEIPKKYGLRQTIADSLGIGGIMRGLRTIPVLEGFARDMEFELVSQTKDEAWFSLKSNDETLAKYPFEFVLEIGYKLSGSEIKVTWRVTNPAKKDLLFSIGGHPAFMCPVAEQGKQSDYYLKLDTDKAITYGLICDGGLLDKDDNLLKVDVDGYCQIDEHMFDKDALIIENRQASKVSLCTPDKKPYLTVSFDAPLFGLWSPAGMGAPFICIEPWYGRCDRAGFAGELKDREYGNSLAQGEKFEKSYTIAIEL